MMNVKLGSDVEYQRKVNKCQNKTGKDITTEVDRRLNIYYIVLLPYL